jgi:hypothetical protein
MFDDVKRQNNNKEQDAAAGKEHNEPRSEMPQAKEDINQRIEKLKQKGEARKGRKMMILAIVLFVLIAGGASAGFMYWNEVSVFLGLSESIVKNECDYDNPNKEYKYKSLSECAKAFISCEEGESIFTDNCGCGCEFNNEEKSVVCAQDAKQCPDGTFVSRLAPDCEFAECPEVEKESGEENKIEYYLEEIDECIFKINNLFQKNMKSDELIADCKIYNKNEISVMCYLQKKDECYAELGAETGDLKYCEKVEDLQKKEQWCFYEIGQEFNNIKACEKITNENFRNSCFLVIGIQTQNKNLCEKISDKELKNYCITDEEKEKDIFGLQSEVLTKDWQTYRNEEYGFELKFPNDWPDFSVRRRDINYGSVLIEFGFPDKILAGPKKGEERISYVWGIEIFTKDKYKDHYNSDGSKPDIFKQNEDYIYSINVGQDWSESLSEQILGRSKVFSTFKFLKDTDNDGLYDDEEEKYGTDINNPDSDGDGYLDGEEVENGFNPTGEGRLAD